MYFGVFPIESVAMNLQMLTSALTEHPTAVLMLCATIPRDRIAANANQDLLKMDGLAKVKQSLVSESNVT